MNKKLTLIAAKIKKELGSNFISMKAYPPVDGIIIIYRGGLISNIPCQYRIEKTEKENNLYIF